MRGGDVDGWVARKQILTLQLLADSPRVFPGVVALVQALEGRVRLGVVTTTWRGNVEAVLEASGLAGSFEFVVAKEDVKATKPDPEGYRLALAKLGLPVADVVTLEDSTGGIEAAQGAGLRVVAIGHRKPKGEWIGDATFLPGFADLDRTLHELGVMG